MISFEIEILWALAGIGCTVILLKAKHPAPGDDVIAVLLVLIALLSLAISTF